MTFTWGGGSSSAGAIQAAIDADNTQEFATFARPVDAARPLVTKLDQKQASAVLTVLSDSTGVAPTTGKWVDNLAVSMGAKWPSAKVVLRPYAAGSSNYPTPATITPGTLSKVVLSDTFARTVANLYGSTPDIGSGVWTASNANLAYALNGDGKATHNDTGSGEVMQRGTFTTPGFVSTVVNWSILTNVSGIAAAMASSWISGSAFLWLQVNNATANIDCKVSTVAGGTVVVSTLTFAAAGITPSSATPQNVTTTIAHNPNGTITFTIGTATYTHTLSGAESTAFAAGSGAGFWGIVDGHSVYDIASTITVPAVTNLDIYNGAVGSTAASYPLTRIAAMLPVAPDLVLINYGHNNITDTPAQFATALDTLVAAIRAVYPAVAIGIVGQNPQKAPSAGIAAHLLREQSKRAYAAANGFGYLPAFEAFQSKDYPGEYIQADGVHPTVSGANDGGAIWATAAQNYLNAASLKPA